MGEHNIEANWIESLLRGEMKKLISSLLASKSVCICMAGADILHAYLLQVLAKGRVTYYHAEALVAKGSKY